MFTATDIIRRNRAVSVREVTLIPGRFYIEIDVVHTRKNIYSVFALLNSPLGEKAK